MVRGTMAGSPPLTHGQMSSPTQESPSSRDAASRARYELACFDRMRTGDETAFEILFRTYAGPLCDFAYSYVGSQPMAQEIVQDLFSRIWERRDTLEIPRSVYAYLFGSTRNRAINHLRDRRVQDAFATRALRAVRTSITSPSAPQEQELEAQALGEALARAVKELPERCREVFTLTRDQHLTYAQVAEVLHISPKTVEIHMGRALALLRRKLEPWLHS
jgi:RNA polymerase sigma-70 factor, ECF subfamily